MMRRVIRKRSPKARPGKRGQGGLDRGRGPRENVDLQLRHQREEPDAELTDSIPPERGGDAIGELAEQIGADPEAKEKRGDDRRDRRRGAPPDMGEALEPDDLVGEAGGARSEEEG